MLHQARELDWGRPTVEGGAELVLHQARELDWGRPTVEGGAELVLHQASQLDSALRVSAFGRRRQQR